MLRSVRVLSLFVIVVEFWIMWSFAWCVRLFWNLKCGLGFSGICFTWDAILFDVHSHYMILFVSSVGNVGYVRNQNGNVLLSVRPKIDIHVIPVDNLYSSCCINWHIDKAGCSTIDLIRVPFVDVMILVLKRSIVLEVSHFRGDDHRGFRAIASLVGLNTSNELYAIRSCGRVEVMLELSSSLIKLMCRRIGSRLASNFILLLAWPAQFTF
ncbi:hypothetical protein AKJ16_DCAP04144 [Drosera capensis]